MSQDMLPGERRQKIVEVLSRDGKVSVQAVSVELDVSVDTVRRDLKELEGAGLLTRVHGGALPSSLSVPTYTERKSINQFAKNAIARETARLILPDQVVIIDSGTSAQSVARHLPLDLRATIVTPSPPVAMVLGNHLNIDVVLLGGTLDKSSMTVIGTTASLTLSALRADVCIAGVCSLHHEIGVTTVSHEEAELKRIMIENSGRVIAPVTADKIGTASPFVVAPMTGVDCIVTDSEVPEDRLNEYRKLGIEVMRVAQ